MNVEIQEDELDRLQGTQRMVPLILPGKGKGGFTGLVTAELDLNICISKGEGTWGHENDIKNPRHALTYSGMGAVDG